MPRDAGRRRIYRSRAVRRRRSALAVAVAVVLAVAVIFAAQGVGRARVHARYDRRAAVAYADAWALKSNPAYWSSPDNDCANFVSQCLAAGGLRPTFDAGRAWHANGTDFPTPAWVNCGAQMEALSAGGTGHSRYLTRSTREPASRWATGDIVYLGNLVDGDVVWQHVIICAGRRKGEWLYDSHTTAHRRRPLSVWYPAHFSQVAFCHVADEVAYDPGE
jgi:hypothetical protein